MLVEEIAPTDIGKHADVVKSAQEDLSTMDVLVCGRCLNVFHFPEEFQQHKEDECEINHSLHKTSDAKPNIWGFLLWKAAKLNSGNDIIGSSTSWGLYQNWVKLDDRMRETWIVAGKTIQSFGKVALSELHDAPVRITKTLLNSKSRDSASPTRKSLPTKNAMATENDKKNSITPPPTIKSVNRIARRTLQGTNETVPEKVEKIVAKRFNPRRKLHEYLVKWDASAELDNSWESAANLEEVPHFLEVFEKQLARQKQTRALLNAKAGDQNKSHDENKPSQQLTRKLPTLPTTSTDNNTTQVSSSSPHSRPTRTSKTKAMDQVKQWVNETNNAGSSSPLSGNEDESSNANLSGGNAIVSAKRKFNDSDFTNSNSSDLMHTGNTMEDLEEDLIPSHTVKRLKNGSSISVEVKTKTEKVEKIIKVNGTAGGARTTSITGESLPVTANSADVIITQDSSASGVLRKPGTNGISKSEKAEAQIRLLTKAESLVSNTGIVRVLGGSVSGEETAGVQIKNPLVTPASTAASRLQQLRSTGGSGVSSTTGGRQTPTTVAQRQQQGLATRPGVAAAQRKVNQVQKPGVRVSNTPIRNTSHALNQSGRLIISRTSNHSTPVNNQRQIGNKSVTPEEKIFNLSKSGDLKVTRKVMTREEIRIAQQQRLQQRQPQSQVQIQKVQQIAPPRARGGGTTNVRATQQQQEIAPVLQVEEEEEEEHQAQLCPITGKLIGQEETQLKIEQEQQEQLAQEQQQQQLQALLSGGDQQMLTNEDGSPLLVRGEDGTVYQVAGKNAEGQTILVTQGPDGEQQFAYVAAAEGEENNQVLTLDNAVAEAVAALPAEQQAEALAAAAAGESGQFLVQMTEEELAQHQAAALQVAQQNATDPNAAAGVTNQLTIQTGEQGVDAQDGNIPAEVVQADLPSPGGTRRVVLLLNDGTFMMTEMHDDEFKALNITT